ncbi:MAG: guanylate kinase [Actinomycetaceae bacterium]|nr:guanylate kinase [Actinomycetaceae bacterium]
MKSPRLVVIVGPSGVGKGTVVRRLLEMHPEVALSISATTRSPRPGEVDGVNYHFVTDEQFDDLIASGGMLEWAQVFGTHRYGTPRHGVESALARGVPVLLEIDLDGARQVRQSMPEALFIFLAPPSWEELEQRLIGRGTETPQEIERRLATAKQELAAKGEFDHIVTNDDIDSTASQLAQLMGLE